MSVMNQAWPMNELRTLIDLCPGVRLPQYEPEIFSNKKLTKYYLRKFAELHGLCGGGCDCPAQVIAYYYALHVMKCRWPEAEVIIATAPRWAYCYARFVMNSRWPEAEAIIATGWKYRKLYNDTFGTNI